MSYRRVAQLRSAEQFRAHLAEIGADIPFDEAMRGRQRCAARPTVHGFTAKRSATASPCCRWKAGTAAPTVSQPIWCGGAGQRFGISGAKLIWGGEAVAVRHDGRANHRQLVINARHGRAARRPARPAGDDASASTTAAATTC